jgi:hypothetical protein
MQNVITHS